MKNMKEIYKDKRFGLLKGICCRKNIQNFVCFE